MRLTGTVHLNGQTTYFGCRGAIFKQYKVLGHHSMFEKSYHFGYIFVRHWLNIPIVHFFWGGFIGTYECLNRTHFLGNKGTYQHSNSAHLVIECCENGKNVHIFEPSWYWNRKRCTNVHVFWMHMPTFKRCTFWHWRLCECANVKPILILSHCRLYKY